MQNADQIFSERKLMSSNKMNSYKLNNPSFTAKNDVDKQQILTWIIM